MEVNIMKYTILISSLLLTTFAHAHSAKMLQEEFQVNAQNCPKKQTILLASMKISTGTFSFLKSDTSSGCTEKRLSASGRESPMLDCGQFDDWRLAYDMGNNMCESLHSNMMRFDNTLNPDMQIFTRFEGPYEFKGDEHHQKFKANMGVTLACYICDTAK
jgi:hypothetical protein